MIELKKTGGARIGIMNATWPFATLKVNKNQLQLNATILGNLVFAPQDVVSIEPYGLIPVIGRGLKINHRVKAYNSKVIFWTLGSPEKLLHDIDETGFLNNSAPIQEQLQQEVQVAQNNSGFPIKTRAAVLIVIIWNVLFSIDLFKIFTQGMQGSPLGVGAKSAIGFLLILSILLLSSDYVRSLILKEGYSIDGSKRFIYFLIFICGFLFINISVMS